MYHLYIRNAYISIFKNKCLQISRYSLSFPNRSKDYQDLSNDLKELLVSKKVQEHRINNVQTVLKPSNNKCGDQSLNGIEEIEEEEMEDMFIEGPAGIEWNGPTRGGS